MTWPQRPGLGKPGYCKICDSDLKVEVNRRLRAGLSSKRVIA